MFGTNYNDYVNFLFHGADVFSKFDPNDFISVYKNKYNRLLNDDISNDIYQANIGYIIFKNIIDILNKSKYSVYLNQSKIKKIDEYFNDYKLDRLIFCNSFSFSFLEIIMNNDDEWEKLKQDIINEIGVYSKFIYDDSLNKYRILSFTIKLSEYMIHPFIPDVSNYNINIVLAYLSIQNDNKNFISIKDKDITDRFTSELKYYLSPNSKTLSDGLYTDILNNLANIEYLIDSNNLSKLYGIILNNINIDNIDSIIQLQYMLFTYIYKNYHLLISLDDINIRFIYKFISLDIFIYNMTRLVDDMVILKKIFSLYNFYIIKLQDIIDQLDIGSNKQIFVSMYKNQLRKSRNKIQERMI